MYVSTGAGLGDVRPRSGVRVIPLPAIRRGRGLGLFDSPGCASPWDDNCRCSPGDQACMDAFWYSSPYRAVAKVATPSSYWSIQCDTCPDCRGYLPISGFSIESQGFKPWAGGCPPGVDPLANALANTRARLAAADAQAAAQANVTTPAYPVYPTYPAYVQTSPAAAVVTSPGPTVPGPVMSSAPAPREISLTPAVSAAAAGEAASPLSSFLSSNFGIGGFEVPAWGLAVVVAGGLWLALRPGGRG